MKSEINLLIDKKSTANEKLKKRIFILRLVSISFLFFVSISAVMLFIFILFSPLSGMRKTENTLTFQMTQFDPKVLKLEMTKERLVAINAILKKRGSQDQILNLLQPQKSQGVTIESLSLDKNVVLVRISSPSLSAIDSYVTALESEFSKRDDFTTMSLDGLSLETDTSKYVCSVDIVL